MQEKVLSIINIPSQFHVESSYAVMFHLFQRGPVANAHDSYSQLVEGGVEVVLCLFTQGRSGFIQHYRTQRLTDCTEHIHFNDIVSSDTRLESHVGMGLILLLSG